MDFTKNFNFEQQHNKFIFNIEILRIIIFLVYLNWNENLIVFEIHQISVYILVKERGELNELRRRGSKRSRNYKKRRYKLVLGMESYP